MKDFPDLPHVAYPRSAQVKLESPSRASAVVAKIERISRIVPNRASLGLHFPSRQYVWWVSNSFHKLDESPKSRGFLLAFSLLLSSCTPREMPNARNSHVFTILLLKTLRMLSLQPSVGMPQFSDRNFTSALAYPFESLKCLLCLTTFSWNLL